MNKHKLLHSVYKKFFKKNWSCL